MSGESDKEEDKENDRRGIMGIDHDVLSEEDNGYHRGHAGGKERLLCRHPNANRGKE